MGDVLVTFADDDLAVSNQHALELEGWLRDDVPEADVKRLRSDKDHQSAGEILQVLFDSSSAVAVAGGIAGFATRFHNAKMRLSRRRPDGSTEEIVVDGNPSKRHQEIIEEFLDADGDV